MELAIVKSQMNQLKIQILSSNPISRQNVSSNFDQVDENTQGSVRMQNQIEYASSFYSTQKRLISDLITNKIHDQKDTNLCVSISVLSALRAAQVFYLDKTAKKDSKKVRKDQDDILGEFSFDKCLVLFTGCISPRSLDGIILNSTGSSAFKEKQVQSFGTAIYRLVNRTMIDIDGWRRLAPITALFRKYQIDPDTVKLDFEECYHPLSQELK